LPSMLSPPPAAPSASSSRLERVRTHIMGMLGDAIRYTDA
jgi:hypothetical protein